MKKVKSIFYMILVIMALVSCEKIAQEGKQGEKGDPGTPARDSEQILPTTLNRFDDFPGVNITVKKVTGASGTDGTFQKGDKISVTFTVTKNNTNNIPLSQLDYGAIYLSGPTENYQRVIELQNDLRTATKNSDDTYTYTFSKAIPDTYQAPVNDTATFGTDNGEMAGVGLLAGTYTIGIEAYKNYSVDGIQNRDAGNATEDIMLLGATALNKREVVKLDNCNQCHISLRVHGGIRRNVKLCVLCHTAGAEDKNVTTVENGTPNITIEFKVMVHKIHNGKHLPSVQGVGINADGSARDFTITKTPYKIMGFNNTIHDYSGVGYPVWPNLNISMPRNSDYTKLTTTEKSTDDLIRQGVTACAKCHGDPDGTGPLTAPVQGDLAYTQLSRRVCGSCHDDIDWTKTYLTMPAQANDSNCLNCHPQTGSANATIDGHLHPLNNPSINPGINIAIVDMKDEDGNTTINPGKKITLTFTVKDDAGNDIDPKNMTLNAVIVGPNNNRNLILNTSVAGSILTADGSKQYTIKVPDAAKFVELVGTTADDNTIESLPATSSTGHISGLTTVYERDVTANGGSSTLTQAATKGQYYVFVSDVSAFAANDNVVIDDGQAGQEYHIVSSVNAASKRIDFRENSYGFKAGLKNDHAIGITVTKVTLNKKTAGTDYNLDNSTGIITEIAAGSFKAGDPILVSYTPEFVFPAVYPKPLNAVEGSTDIDDSYGKWEGKNIDPGTYNIGVWAFQTITEASVKDMSYRSTSPAANKDFLVGTATEIKPYSIIAPYNGETCKTCHSEIYFHGGSRRGLENCLLCHGTAGAEDNPKYISPTSPETTGGTINFRSMLHKIHAGNELERAFVIAGRGGSSHTFEDIEFPALPGGIKNCSKCHGTSTAWKIPAARSHSTQQTNPSRPWRAACATCHDSVRAEVHIEAMSSATKGESCEVCHGPRKDFDVEVVHKIR